MAHQPWRVAVPCLSRCRARLADGADESKLTFLQALIIFLAQLIWSQGLPGPHTYSDARTCAFPRHSTSPREPALNPYGSAPSGPGSTGPARAPRTDGVCVRAWGNLKTTSQHLSRHVIITL